MGSILPELQAVLREAARAQELEDGQDWPAAIDVYYRAGCQLSYMLDMHVDKDGDCTLAEVLCGLHSQYQQRISVSTRDREANAALPIGAVLQAVYATQRPTVDAGSSWMQAGGTGSNPLPLETL
jgi:hypothetical protein